MQIVPTALAEYFREFIQQRLALLGIEQMEEARIHYSPKRLPQ
jgi:hypothetical protein